MVRQSCARNVDLAAACAAFIIAELGEILDPRLLANVRWNWQAICGLRRLCRRFLLNSLAAQLEALGYIARRALNRPPDVFDRPHVRRRSR